MSRGTRRNDCTSAVSAEATTPPSRPTPDARDSGTDTSGPEFRPEAFFLDAQGIDAGSRLIYPDLQPFVHHRLPTGTRNPHFEELFNRIIHPYDVSEFRRLLSKHNLTQHYPHLIDNLSHGFPLGRMPKLQHTVIIPNHKSVEEHRDAVHDYLKEELEKQPMSGPFSRSEMEEICRGPFYSSPMIVVLQEQEPGTEAKKRICGATRGYAVVVAIFLSRRFAGTLKQGEKMSYADAPSAFPQA
jgi:hypothetical protein